MKIRLCIFLIVYLLVSGSQSIRSEIIINFESQPLNAYYGNGYGHLPRDIIFIENNMPVQVDSFFWQSGGTFNNCNISDMDSIGASQVMWFNNINLMLNYTEAGYDVQYVTFEYADFGGMENLIVNGDRYVGELEELDGLMLGGVQVFVTALNRLFGEIGMVTLIGPVAELKLGGQEFIADQIMAYTEPHPVSRCVHFESLNHGDFFGANAGNNIGDKILVENGVPVSVEFFNYALGGGTFNFCVVDAAFNGMGYGNVMNTNNINLGFNLTRLGFIVHYVHFEYLDLGGFENFIINGDLRIGELADLNGTVVGGAFVTVQTTPVSGGIRAEVEIEGDMEQLVVGGQEFWMDNICFWAENPYGVCERHIFHEELIFHDQFGQSSGDSPGDIIFIESDIPVGVGHFYWTNGDSAFNVATVDSAFNGFGNGQIMGFNNINNHYHFDATGFIPNGVVFEFLDLGGYENIAVNHQQVYIGELTEAPLQLTPTVQMHVAYSLVQGGKKGIILLKGPIRQLIIGGQEFWLDNLCTGYEIPDKISEKGFKENQYILSQNYPNPFNPETVIRYYIPVTSRVELTLFNICGQQVITLVNKIQSPGEHQVIFNAQGLQSGIYFYQLSAGDWKETKKMLLIR